MKTPFGFECRYFYADYHRGRHKEECRLVQNRPGGQRWTVGLCQTCPTPKILLANACPHMVIEGKVVSGFLGLRSRMEITAACLKTAGHVPEPEIGCGHCHESTPFS